MQERIPWKITDRRLRKNSADLGEKGEKFGRDSTEKRAGEETCRDSQGELKDENGGQTWHRWVPKEAGKLSHMERNLGRRGPWASIKRIQRKHVRAIYQKGRGPEAGARRKGTTYLGSKGGDARAGPHGPTGEKRSD